MLYAGLLGVMYFVLSVLVIRLRTATKTGIGHDSDPTSPLFRAVRIHGNFAEFVPFILLLMAFDEISGRSQMIMHIFGAALILARVSHYFGLSKTHGKSTGRLVGGMSTFIIMVTLSTLLIIKGILL